MKSILDLDKYELLPINITEAIKQLADCGLSVKFIGHSFSNGCSIYFKDTVGNKYRFSDHGITNFNRINSEYCFNLPFKKTGTIANQFNCKDTNKFGFRESFVLYNDNKFVFNLYNFKSFDVKLNSKNYSYTF